MDDVPPYQQLFEASPHPYLILRADDGFTIAAVSNKYLEINDTQREAIVGHGLFDIFPDNPDSACSSIRDFRVSLSRVISTKRPDTMSVQKCDIPLRDDSGNFERKYWNPVNTPVFDAQGHMTYIIHHMEEVTESMISHERAINEHEQLRESEICFQAAVEQAGVGISIISLDGRWLHVNRKLCQITGYSRDELRTLTFQNITYPDDLDADLNYVRQVLAGEIATFSMEKRYIRKDSSMIWINLTVSLVRKPDNAPDYFITIVEDIQIRKEVEASLKEVKRIANLGHWTWNVNTNKCTWSEGIYRIYGRDLDLPPLSYQETSQYFTAKSWVNLTAAVEECLEKGLAYECDAEVVRSDGGHRWVIACGKAIRDADGQVIALRGTMQDITERKLAEVVLQESKEQLKLFIEYAPASLALFDQKMCYLALSQRWRSDYALGDGNLLGLCHYDVFPEIGEEWKATHRSVDRNQPLLRVLYIEHNISDIDLMRRHLASHAPHVHLTAMTSTQDALALLPTDSVEQIAAFDVLLIDYRMPGMDGLEFIKRLRNDRKLDIPIVLITGQGNEMATARALHLGVDDYLSKHEGYLYEIVAILEKVRHQAELTRERISLKRTSLRFSHLLAASPTILYNLHFIGETLQSIWVSENIERLLGYMPEEALAPDWWCSHVHPDDREVVLARQSILFTDGQLTHDYRFFHRDGRVVWILDELRLVRGVDGRPLEIVGAWLDISEHKRDELIRGAHQSALDLIVTNQPLVVILNDIAKRLETINPDMLVSILLLDKHTECLKHGVAPSLPNDYNAAIDRLRIGDGVGSCGTSAWRGEPVIVSDIDQHPYWQPYLELTRKANLHACWSVPFKDETGRVLGTFAIYCHTPWEPVPADLVLINQFVSITALAVQKVYATETLKQAAAVFESAREGIVIVDLEPRILAVNRAYTEITGYSEAQVLGKNPKIIRSGRHDEAFYKTMWRSLIQVGYWRGEIWNRRKNGEIYPQLLTINIVRNDRNEPCNYVGVFTDITQMKESEERLMHIAHYDPLTGLPNRLLVQSRLHHAIERAQRRNYRLATLYLDLDRFKNVNDSLGHPIGDELLIMLASRLKKRLREEDTLARLGGDEFLLVLENIRDPSEPTTVAKTLINLLTTPFTLPSGHEIFINASIGISVFPDDANSVTELIQHADMAMYLAKQEGRNTYRYHTEALSIAANERLILETRLRYALTAGEFVLHYQPLIHAGSGRVVGVEALVRWQPPDKAMVPPGKFIPIAEETGLIVPLGEWVLRTACAQGRAWMDAGLPPLVMAVNLSVRQFQSANLIELVQRVLAETQFPATCLELELTESMFMEHAEQSIDTLRTLKAMGVRLAIDDFGTGYSSLTYLKRFPIDKLKIDQSFVHGLADDPNDREIAATIIAMARSLKLAVLAEGVESEEQLDFLRQHGCDYYQGFLFHKPVPALEFEAWLREKSMFE